MPLISIIIPVYNAEKYINRCIDSILAQTFTDFELILINDGSTDRSGIICDEYSTIDKRIKVIHKENGGPADARNIGIDISVGKYIGFVDSDDYIAPNMYELLYEKCESNKVNIAMCGRYDVYDNRPKAKFVLNTCEKWTNKVAMKNLLTWNNIDSSPCDKLFDRRLLENTRFPINKNVEDMYIIYKLIHLTNGVTHVGQPLYYYCHRPDSRSVEEFSIKRLDILEVSNEIRNFIIKRYPELKEEADNFYYKNILLVFKMLSPISVRNKYLSHYKNIKNRIINNTYEIVNNRYIDKRNKLISLLIFFRVFNLVTKITKIYK